MTKPESTAVWSEDQITEDSLDVMGDTEDDKTHYTNWYNDE